MLARITTLLALPFLVAACNDGVIAYENSAGLSVAQLEERNINEASSVQPLWQGYPRGQNQWFRYGLSTNAIQIGACRTTSGFDRARMEVKGFMLGGQEQFSYTQTQLARALDNFPGLNTNYTQLVSDGRRSNPSDMYFLCYFAGAGTANDRMIFNIQPQSTSELAAMDIAVEFNMLTGDITDVELFFRGNLPTRVTPGTIPQNGNVLEVSGGNLVVNGQPVLFNGAPIPARNAKGQFD